MSKDYKISSDGTIFEIKEDCSIAKIARIDEKGNISSINGNINRQQGDKGKYWFFIIVFAIAIVFLGMLYLEAEDNYTKANRECYEYKEKYKEATSSMRSQINTLQQDMNNAKSELSSLKKMVSNIYPLIITDIEIANVTYNGDIHTNYGNTLYGSSTMYLQPRIKYIGLTSGNKTLKVKWYDSDGTIRRGTSSPSGFSQSSSVYIYNGDNTYTLSGWGNSTKGHWRAGTYRIEIWYENSCLRSKTFTIY